MIRIDTHQHFWVYRPDQYPWMTGDMTPLRRDFLPSDLAPLLGASAVDKVVSVQARQMVEETDWLLKLAGKNRFICGVVGWVPLVDKSVKGHLERLSTDPLLRGVRHVLHDEPDDAYVLRNDFNRGVAVLREFGLTYDILISERHLPQTIEFVDRHPNQVFILDHIAKPRIRDGRMSPWRESVMLLAERENVYCKISGMVTESDWRTWSEPDLRPYFDVVLEAFGPDRLMFGSDWPVLLLAADYLRWNKIVQALVSPLSETEQERIMGDTATVAYGLQA
jgi:L-fuconolactonase